MQDLALIELLRDLGVQDRRQEDLRGRDLGLQEQDRRRVLRGRLDERGQLPAHVAHKCGLGRSRVGVFDAL